MPANSANLTGTGIDTDGTISSYSWVKIAGPAAGTIVTANAATTTVNNLVQGVYQYELTVTDNNGATGKDTVRVTVNAAVNIAPAANAGADIAITLPANSANLTGTGIDTDGTISSYAWVKIAGPAAGTIINPATATTTLTSLVQGVYQFQLIVTDNNGAIGKDTVQVTVNEAVNINQIPVANAGADINIVLPSNTVQLTGTGIDSDGVIISYNWSVISGPAGFIFSSPLLSNTRIDSLFQGVYDVELTVKDNLGAIAKDTVTITVSAPRLSNISSNEFKVYPNPVRDIATLEINTLNTHTNLSVSIFDESGKLVLYNEFVTATSYTQRKLNMTSFSNGFYILNVRFDDGKMYSKRIFKYGER